MKSIKYSLCGIALIAAGALSSCQNSYDAPDLQTPEPTWKVNTTLMELKEMIAEGAGSNTNYAELALKKEIEAPDGAITYEDIVVHGRVISCDASGNIYQSLVIQDETTAFNLSIRQGNMWSWFREGQDILVNVTGLYMGLYNGLYQLGWLGEYHEAESMTFMSWDMFREHVQLNGLPNNNVVDLTFADKWPSNNPYCLVTSSLNDINSFAGGNAMLMSQLVEIRDVTWENAGVDTFAPYQESVNRTIMDSQGNSLTVRTSGYSNFYNETLPLGTGSVRGILSYFNGWQLLLRDIDDVMFDDMAGQTQATALTVNEAIAKENTGVSLWVKGYVVGSVKGNVNSVTSNDDIIFGADAQFPNTVVIAETPSEKNYQNCMIVELKPNTLILEDVNLVDNPGVYGKLLYLRGNLEEYLGLSGITNCDTDYYYEGMPQEEATEVTYLSSGLEDFTFENVKIPSGTTYVWSWDASYTCAKASGFIGGSNKESDSYLVSPVITLSRRPTGTVEQALNYLNGNPLADNVEICIREGVDGEWTPLSYTGQPNGSSWTFTTSTLNLTPYAGKKVQIGFHYRSSDTCATTWEVRNLKIK